QEKSEAPFGYEVVRQFEPFWSDLPVEKAHPGGIASRSVQAGDQPLFDRVTTVCEHDWDCSRSRYGRLCCIGASCRSDDGHLTPNQIGRERRQPIIVTFRPAVFDRDVPTLNKSGFVQPPRECGHEVCIGVQGGAVEKTDCRHRLLCSRRKRPCGSRAAEQRDELAASHMPFKPWDRDIAPERYHIQTLRLIRICVLLGSDAIRCLIGMGLSAACAERKRAGAQRRVVSDCRRPDRAACAGSQSKIVDQSGSRHCKVWCMRSPITTACCPRERILTQQWWGEWPGVGTSQNVSSS